MRSVIMAYVVLCLHIVLIAALGLLVIFFRGVVSYMAWIFLAGTIALGLSGYLFYRRMKKEGKTLREMMSSPAFSGRAVEVSLLGGLASFKLGKSPSAAQLEAPVQTPLQLEDPANAHLRQLNELVRLLEDGLITPDEYNEAKKMLFEARQ